MDLGELTNQPILGLAPDKHQFRLSQAGKLTMTTVGTPCSLELSNKETNILIIPNTYLNPGDYTLKVIGKGHYRIKYELTPIKTSTPNQYNWRELPLNTHPQCVGASINNYIYIWTSSGSAYKLINNSWINIDPKVNTKYIYSEGDKLYLIGKVKTKEVLLTSEDGGANWVELTLPCKVNAPNNKTLTINPHLKEHLLLAGDKLYESLDGGHNWRENKGLEALNIKKPTGCLFDKEFRGHIYIWTTRSGLFKSTDSGASWKPIADHTSVEDLEVIRDKLLTLYRGSAYLDNKIIAKADWIKTNPFKEKEVLIGGEKLLHSVDGENFKEVRTSRVIQSIYWDTKDKLWVISDNKLYKAESLYSEVWQETPKGINEEGIYDISAQRGLHIGGEQSYYYFNELDKEPLKEGVLSKSFNTRGNELIRGGSSGIEQWDGKDWALISAKGAHSIALSNQGVLFCDAWGLNTLEGNINTLPKDPQGMGKVFSDKDTIYYQINKDLFKAEGGLVFNQVRHNLPNNWEEVTITASPIDSELWACYGYSGLFISHNKGEVFHKISQVCLCTRMCIGPALAKYEPYCLYITGKLRQEEGVFKSRDKGNTWVKIGELPSSPVTCMTASDVTPGLVFIGTKRQGVYYCQS